MALEQMRRVLKPGGRLVATTNGAGHMVELDKLASGETFGCCSPWRTAPTCCPAPSTLSADRCARMSLRSPVLTPQ